jgi:hypothetical protein
MKNRFGGLVPLMIAVLAVVSTIAMPTVARAQDPPPDTRFSLAANYSFERKQWSAVATSQIDSLWVGALGIKGSSIDLKALVGGDADVIIAGGAVVFSVPIHERIRIGLGISLTKNQPNLDEFFKSFAGFELGGVASLEYQLRFST